MAKGLHGAPSSTKNISFGPLVIKVDGKAKIKDYDPASGADETERVTLTRVGTVADLCKIKDFQKVIVLVWHENVRLTNDMTYFPATKKKATKKGKKK